MKTENEMKDFIVKLANSFKKENAEKEIAKLVVDDLYENDIKKLIKRFYVDILNPVICRIEERIPKTDHSIFLLEILLTSYWDIKRTLEYEIIEYNRTSACCADESSHVINKLIKFLITGEHSSLQETYSDYWKTMDKEEQERLDDWKDNQELTYWSCKRFKTTQEVIEWLLER